MINPMTARKFEMKMASSAPGLAKTIARHVLPPGHRVVLSNSRGPESLAALVAELGSGAAAGTAKGAAEQHLVVLAAKWASVQAALFSVGDWTGRILVDATKPRCQLSAFGAG
jgi:predicted dinucleotide-binding enzyme